MAKSCKIMINVNFQHALPCPKKPEATKVLLDVRIDIAIVTETSVVPFVSARGKKDNKDGELQMILGGILCWWQVHRPWEVANAYIVEIKSQEKLLKFEKRWKRAHYEKYLCTLHWPTVSILILSFLALGLQERDSCIQNLSLRTCTIKSKWRPNIILRSLSTGQSITPNKRSHWSGRVILWLVARVNWIKDPYGRIPVVRHHSGWGRQRMLAFTKTYMMCYMHVLHVGCMHT